MPQLVNHAHTDSCIVIGCNNHAHTDSCIVIGCNLADDVYFWWQLHHSLSMLHGGRSQVKSPNCEQFLSVVEG